MNIYKRVLSYFRQRKIQRLIKEREDFLREHGEGYQYARQLHIEIMELLWQQTMQK